MLLLLRGIGVRRVGMMVQLLVLSGPIRPQRIVTGDDASSKKLGRPG